VNKRRAPIAAALAGMETSEMRELERVRKKLAEGKHDLRTYEQELLQKHSANTAAPVGAPAVLTVPHQWVARHCLWLRMGTGYKAVAARLQVAERWGLGVASVRRREKEHRAVALDFVNKKLAERAANPKYYPKDVDGGDPVEQMLDTVAGYFKNLGR
jgi:hypothetical protein